MISEFAFRNAQALETLVDEHGVQLRTFPDDVMAALYESSKAAIQRQVTVTKSLAVFMTLTQPSRNYCAHSAMSANTPT